jgi:4-hydroxybenzoate polyprenyltransferase
MTTRSEAFESPSFTFLKTKNNAVFNFIDAYVITMRPYLMFISGITGITGMSFSDYYRILYFLGIAISSFLSYGFGQALTDCTQTDTDAISSPYRPLLQGRISKISVFVTSLIGLCFCCSIFIWINRMNLIFSFVGLIGLSTYTYFKRRWWAGPFYNSIIVLLLYILSLNSTVYDYHKHIAAIIATGICIFFGYANFVLVGYFKDIHADRVTGYQTLPVRYGRKVAAVVSDMFAVLTIGGAIYAYSKSISPHQHIIVIAFSIIALGTGVSAILFSQYRLHRIRRDADAHKAIIPGLHGYVFLLTSIIAVNQPMWIVPLLIFIAMYMLVLGKRPERTQI